MNHPNRMMVLSCMKRLVFLAVILLLGFFPAAAREYAVSGPEGGLAMKIALPASPPSGSISMDTERAKGGCRI